jgi:N-acetyl-anhydromuramyl-L-alanine amidase AmpD
MCADIAARTRACFALAQPSQVQPVTLSTISAYCSGATARPAVPGQVPDVSGSSPALARPQETSSFGTPAEGRSQQFGHNRYRLPDACFLPQRHRKDLIVLHFTAGTSSNSAFQTWRNDPRRIATAFGVDPDGSIAEFFPPEAWAYHLGVKGTHHHDRRSIGIEIANVGPLRPDPADPAQLNWWPRNWSTPYCRIDETERYVSQTYRGIHHFATMPETQQLAVASLVRSLCAAFDIPLYADQKARDGVCDLQYFASYRGIASHSNFRQDKWDVGPAFRWDLLEPARVAA